MKNSKIQILRAISIIAVVLIHTCPHGITQVYIRPFINFSVGLFLFLSGYLTNIDSINKNTFYKKRIFRVMFPYIIWTIVYTSMSFISNGVDFNKYIINLLSSKASPAFYYILVYIQFVLFTPLLGKLLKTKYYYIGFIIAPISLLIKYYWLFSSVEPNIYLKSLFDICCLGWFSFYYLGLYLKNKYIKKSNQNYQKMIYVYVILIIVQMIEGYCWFKLGNDGCGTQLKYSGLLTTFVFCIIAYNYINNTKFKGNNKLLITIGNYSFGVYLSHILLLNILKRIVPFWNKIPYIMNSSIVLVISLLLCIIGSKIVGKKLSEIIGFY